MKPATVLIWFFLFATGVFAQPGLVFKSASIQHAGYAAYVIDAENGAVIYDTPQVSLVPASVMKVITTAAALEILGPEFQFHTQVGFTGKIDPEKGLLQGNLVFKGGCDPAFYSEYFPEYYQGTFESWARAILRAGIHQVEGDLVVDLSKMEGASVPGGWLWEDIGNYYGAGVSALTYADNCYQIHFSSANEPGKPAAIGRFVPNMDSLTLISKVISSVVDRDRSVVYGAPGSFTQLVEGTIPQGRADFVVKAAMPDPPRIAASEFVKVLNKYGIKISGRIQYGADLIKSANFKLIADKPSPQLRDLIIPLNHESINLFAEHLLREIGRSRKGSTALVESLEALKAFWQDKKIFLEGFYQTDGSGLSRSNAVCPRTLAEVLRYMYLSVNRYDFFKSLPIAGKSGTLKSAFKGSILENNLQAKTGSMTRARSITGIFSNRAGRKVIFALIINNFGDTQAAIGHKVEVFLNELYLLEEPATRLAKERE